MIGTILASRRVQRRLSGSLQRSFSRAVASELEALEGRLLFSTYTVTTLGDGAGSITPAGAGKFDATTLRTAIAAANAHAGADTIDFASGIAGAIDLGSALPSINDAVTLDGPGASKLTLRRSDAASANFSVLEVGSGKTAAIAGLTIADGTGTAATDSGGNPITVGGGIFNNGGSLKVAQCTITQNSADTGAGIWNSGELTLIGTTVSDNIGEGVSTLNGFGGGIYSTGTLTVQQSTVSNNTALFGAGIENRGALAVAGSTIAGNTTDSFGAGIENDSNQTLTLANSTIANNNAYFGSGAGIYTYSSGMVNLTNCTLAGNTARAGFGAGIENGFNGGTLHLAHCTLAGNTAEDGGAIYVTGGTLALANCTLTGNNATTDGGGGIYSTANGTLILNACSLSGNSALAGGGGAGAGIDTFGATTASNCTFSGNHANNGGGISNDSPATLLANCSFTGNSAFFSGGGIDDYGTLALAACTFSNNDAHFGGGIVNEYPTGVLTLTNCTLAGNSAFYSGGGIDNTGGIYVGEDLPTMTLLDCTLSGNVAKVDGGGGIYNSGASAVANLVQCTLSGNSTDADGGGISNAGVLALTNCTVSGNAATQGGGGVSNSAAFTLANTIVAGNVRSSGAPTVPSDIVNTGAIASSAHDLIGTGGSGGLVNGKSGNLVGIAPAALKLGPLINNGGPTQTIALLPGSVAIDAGSNALAIGPDGKLLATDQRGLPRISGAAADIGAVEFQLVPRVLGFGLLDAMTGKSLGNLANGQTISLSRLDTTHLDVLALASDGTGSVTFSLNGKFIGTNSLHALFTLLGAEHRTPAGGLDPGIYTLIVQPFGLKYALGLPGAFAAIQFTVVA